MHCYDAEGECNPRAAPGPHWRREGWDRLLADAQTAVRVTLDELALLAGIVTAENVTQRMCESMITGATQLEFTA